MQPTLTPNLARIPWWRSALRMIRMAMLPVALGCLGYFAWVSRVMLSEVLNRADTSYLLLALVLWMSAHLVSPLLTMLSLGRRHQPLSYKTAFKIHALNIPARYIPGGVWHTVGRVADFRDRGFASRRLTAFVFLENSLAASVTLAIGGASVWYARGLEGWGKIGAVSALAGVAGLVLSRLITNRWILQGKGGEKIPFRLYVLCIATVGLFWMLASAAFVSYLHAFPGWAQSVSWLRISGAYLLAWGLGFLAVFAPQGVGVFETVLASLISNSLTVGTIVVLVGGFRIIMFSADVTVWLVSRSTFFRKR